MIELYDESTHICNLELGKELHNQHGPTTQVVDAVRREHAEGIYSAFGRRLLRAGGRVQVAEAARAAAGGR